METLQILPIRMGVDQGVIAMNENFTLLKVPGLEPHHQMLFRIIQRELVGGVLTPI